MRLIDAEELKAEINNSKDRAFEKIGAEHLLEKLLFTQVIEAVIKKIDEQPTAQMWVPCGERLPEESGEYIVTFISNSGSRCSTTAKYLSDIKRWCVFYGYVSAWMEKPELWKGEEK